jgi:hypothetical protein
MSDTETSSVASNAGDEISQRKAALMATLSELRPQPAASIVSIAAIALGLLGALQAQVPMATKIALLLGTYFAAAALFETWVMRRRFQAALELLGLSKQ